MFTCPSCGVRHDRSYEYILPDSEVHECVTDCPNCGLRFIYKRYPMQPQLSTICQGRLNKEEFSRIKTGSILEYTEMGYIPGHGGDVMITKKNQYLVGFKKISDNTEWVSLIADYDSKWYASVVHV